MILGAHLTQWLVAFKKYSEPILIKAYTMLHAFERAPFEQYLAEANDNLMLRSNLNLEGRATFLPWGSPDLPFPEVCEKVASQLLSKATARYTSDVGQERKLHSVVAVSTTANAWATWTPAKDWAVVATGLLKRISEFAIRMSGWVADWPGEETQPDEIKWMRELASRRGQFGSSNELAEVLFAAGLGFFLGHELSHLLEGHQGIFAPTVRAVDEQRVAVDTSTKVQALEMHADHDGSFYATQVTAFALGRYLIIEPGHEQRVRRRQFAFVVAIGVFGAMWVLQPKHVSLQAAAISSHPPVALRILWMMHNLTNTLAGAFQLDPDDEERVKLDACAARAMLLTNALPQHADAALLFRRPMQRLRDSGIAKWLFDDAVSLRVEALQANLQTMKSTLSAHRRYRL